MFHLHLQWVMFVVCRKTLTTNYFSGNYMVFRYVLKNPLVVRVIKSTTTENAKFSHILITSDNYSLPLVALQPFSVGFP